MSTRQRYQPQLAVPVNPNTLRRETLTERIRANDKPLPPTWRATITLGNYREREQQRGRLLPCEREEA